MFRHVRTPSVSRAKRSREPLLPASADHDDVLLPSNGSVASSLAFFPSKELKYFDTYFAAPTILACPVVWGSTNTVLQPSAPSDCISAPLRGDGGSNRSGRGILIKNLQLSGVLYRDAEPVKFAPPAPTYAYVAVVLDTQSNGAAPASYDIFVNDSGSVSTAFPPFRNMASNSRFQVLKWEIFKLGSHLAFTIDDTVVPAEFSHAGDTTRFDWFLPLDFLCRFTNGDGGIASVVDTSLHVVAYRFDGVAVDLYCKSRIRFADIE